MGVRTLPYGGPSIDCLTDSSIDQDKMHRHTLPVPSSSKSANALRTSSSGSRDAYRSFTAELFDDLVTRFWWHVVSF